MVATAIATASVENISTTATLLRQKAAATLNSCDIAISGPPGCPELAEKATRRRLNAF